MLYFLIFLSTFLLVIFSYIQRNYNIWSRNKIPYIKPLPFVGNIAPLVFFTRSIGNFFGDIYREHRDKPYIGVFFGTKPCLVVNDYGLVDNIMHKDFNHFSQRIFSPDDSVDPLGARSLFALSGPRWKVTRSKLSPAFTTVKMKVLFDEMLVVAKNFSEALSSVKTVQIADLSVRYTIDAITTAVFGFNGKAIEDPEHDDMRQMAAEMFSGKLWPALKSNLIFLAPQLLAALKVQSFTTRSTEMMRSIVQHIANDRIKNNTRRNDFMDLMLEHKKNGGWVMEDGKIFELEGDNLAAQIFMFLTAGYETSSSAVTFALIELARNPEIQENVRNEINAVIQTNGGLLAYDCLKEMKYMDMVLNETMRKYPPFPFLDKTCSANYKIPGTETVIPKGTFIMIPMLGFHHDERYWPEPDKFNPERFRSAENLQGKPYFPFGSGLRMCLGMRLAILQAKLGIIAAVRHHILSTDVKDIVIDPKRFTTLPQDDVTIKVLPLH